MTSDWAGSRLRTSNFFAVHLTAAALLIAIERWSPVGLPTAFFVVLLWYLLTRVAWRIVADFASSRTAPYVVRRHYGEDIVEYETLKRSDATSYVLELLDGLANFLADNPEQADQILKAYSVSVSVPTRFAKSVEKILRDIQATAIDTPFSHLMANHPEYDVIATLAFGAPAGARHEVRLNIKRKDLP